MNANPGKPLIAGNKKTPNLPVGQRPLARLDFAGDYDGNGLVDWLDGAKLVRARMPEIPTHYYNGKAAFSSLAQGLGPRSDHGPRTLCG
jgi:hypothetical protein